MEGYEGGPQVGDPDFWIGDAPDDLDQPSLTDEAEAYEGIEDLVYERLHEATQNGSAEYSASEFQSLTDNFVALDPSEETGRPDDLNGLMLVDGAGKALYALKEEHGDTVELDIRVFGDRSGVNRYVEDLPTGGYVAGVDTVQGQAFRNATANAEEHPMNVETETQLSEPGSTPDENFTNSQAERIVEEVLGD